MASNLEEGRYNWVTTCVGQYLKIITRLGFDNMLFATQLVISSGTFSSTETLSNSDMIVASVSDPNNRVTRGKLNNTVH
jgi:hypothetical protein